MSAITPEATAKHIGSLLGMSVVAKKGAPADLKGPQAIALIDDEQKELVCVLQFDLPLAASTAAGLSRIPAGAAQDAVKKGALDEMLMENFHEVANVLTVLTTAAIGRRTILRKVAQGKDAAAPDIAGFVSKAKNKLAIHVSVPGYQGGTLVFCHN